MPERVIESLGVMGWGVGCGWEIIPVSSPSSSPPPPKFVLLGETVSSRLGLRTEISARYYRETTRTDVPHFVCFHAKCDKSEEMHIF